MVKTYKIVLFFMLVFMYKQSFCALKSHDAQVQQRIHNQQALSIKISQYSNLKKLRSDRINIFRFEALSFFVRNIKEQKVLDAVFRSIQDFPDRAIKLYFYCLDLQYRGLWDDESVSVIEDFIRIARYDLQFITFMKETCIRIS